PHGLAPDGRKPPPGPRRGPPAIVNPANGTARAALTRRDHPGRRRGRGGAGGRDRGRSRGLRAGSGGAVTPPRDAGCPPAATTRRPPARPAARSPAGNAVEVRHPRRTPTPPVAPSSSAAVRHRR